ncbi:unnamed protein product, partial [Mesorhabditis spiculigera]
MSSALGRPVRVGVFEHDPDAFKCFRNLPHKTCTRPGGEMEIVEMVMKLLNWDWEVVDTDKSFNVVNDFGNLMDDGNFSGIMGLLAEDKIDMSGLSIRITPERMKVAHFTFPIRYFQQVYIISRPPESDFRNFIFSTFSLEIWLLLLGAIILVASFRFLVNVFFLHHEGPKTSIGTRSLLEVYAMVVRQKTPLIIELYSGVILDGTMILLTMVMYIYYQSSMNSKLTAPSVAAVPFRHQDQLIDLLEHHKKYLTYYMDVPLEGSNRKNVRRLKKIQNTSRIVTHMDEKGLIMEMKKGGVFYSTYDIEFLPNAVSSWNKEQELTVIRDTTGIISYVAFGFSKSNKRLCNRFNKALVQVLPGIPRITLRPGYGRKKDAEDSMVKAKRTSLSLVKHLEQLFELYVIGMCCCVLVLLLEHVANRFWRSRREQTYVITGSETNLDKLKDLVRKMSTSTLRRIDRLDSTQTAQDSQREFHQELPAIPEDDDLDDSIFTISPTRF